MNILLQAQSIIGSNADRRELQQMQVEDINGALVKLYERRADAAHREFVSLSNEPGARVDFPYVLASLKTHWLVLRKTVKLLRAAEYKMIAQASVAA